MTFYNIRYIGEPIDPVCTVLHTEEARHPAMSIGDRIGHQGDDRCQSPPLTLSVTTLLQLFPISLFL